MADYDIHDLLRQSATDVLDRLDRLRLSERANYATLDFDGAKRILRVASQIRSSPFAYDTTTHGQIVAALEDTRRYALRLIAQGDVPGSSREVARMLAQASANYVHAIVAHPDYKPPRRYP